MDCLVTKLKSTVNNTNLPILKTDIDVFTKQAISASGNDSMTEEQKWSLDNYFERIGALSNSGIWTKIKALYIPAILTDRTKIFVNYKNMQAAPGFNSRQMLLNGGAYASVQQKIEASSDIMMNGADCSFYFSCDRNILTTSAFSNIGDIFRSEDANSINIAGLTLSLGTGYMQFGINENGFAIGTGFRKYYQSDEVELGSEFLITRSGTTVPVCSLLIRDMNNIDKSEGFSQYIVEDRPATDDNISTTIKILLRTDNIVKYNIIAVGQALTSIESQNLVEAGIELKKAFVLS